MTMKVTISIRGDAMIYERNDAWNVTFITDECHKLNFSADGAAANSLRVEGMTRFIAVKPKAPVSTNRGVGVDFDKIMNLNHPSLHGVDANGKSNLLTMANSGPGRELVHMTVPIGTASGETLVDYWYAEHPDGQRKPFDHKVARVIKIAFELNEDAGLAIEVQDKSDSQTFEYGYAKRLELEFDNDCQGTSIENDFLHYYDWVRDKRSTPAKQIQFVAGKQTPLETATLNCDPIAGWPDLGG